MELCMCISSSTPQHSLFCVLNFESSSEFHFSIASLHSSLSYSMNSLYVKRFFGGNLHLAQSLHSTLLYQRLHIKPPTRTLFHRPIVSKIQKNQVLERNGALVEEENSKFKLHTFSSSSELFQKLQSSEKKEPYVAMYSSVYDGIVTDPNMMLIPINDHMVHRGHGVFDTMVIMDGFLYELDLRLNRLLRSAERAKISPPFSREALRNIMVHLAAASKCRKGIMRMWLSSGPGDFSLSPAGCPTSAFYAVVTDDDFFPCKEGIKVITSTVPMKPPLLATMKNVNYLPNVLAKIEAEEKGAYDSIWVDEDNYIAEGSKMNVAFITHNKEFVMPSFEKILSGCTAKRLLELAAKLVENGRLKEIKTCNITADEAKGSAEMMYVATQLPVLPIVMWDERPIGNGKVGELTMALSNLLWEDMIAGPETVRIPVPYSHYPN